MSIIEKLNGLNKPYKIFTDPNLLEFEALDQFVDAMAQDFVVKGALMPDAHKGYSLPIGGVVQTKGWIVPAYVGYDIGCGMCAVRTSFNAEMIREQAETIQDVIYATIPVGHNHRDSSVGQIVHIQPLLKNVTHSMYQIYNQKGGDRQLGTLGGGNHFIEIGVDGDGYVWIVLHSGSRGVGHGCATHYMKAASPTGKATEGHHGFDVNSQLGQDYINDMNFCLEWALWNRKTMIYQVIQIIRDLGISGGMIDVEDGVEGDVIINRNHNHAETKDGIHWTHRKGATHAEEGMLGVIPGTMRDGSFIVRGKGNEDSMCSSSHGAGRVLGRKEAKRLLDLDTFEEDMDGIVAPVTFNHIDESPRAYKDIYQVMDDQKELVEVIAHEKPILVIKG